MERLSSDRQRNMPKKPPSLRERQAQLTRDEILKAARRLFAERGYTRTSVRDIAEAAGVSAQTVYDSIGSKQALVARLNDLIDAEAGIADIAGAAAESGDPRRGGGNVGQDHPVDPRALRRHHPRARHRCGGRARSRRSHSPRVTPPRRRGRDGGRAAPEMDALDESVDADAAIETLAAISDVRFALLLRDSYGWSLDRIESWIAATSQALLLRSQVGGVSYCGFVRHARSNGSRHACGAISWWIALGPHEPGA